MKGFSLTGRLTGELDSWDAQLTDIIAIARAISGESMIGDVAVLNHLSKSVKTQPKKAAKLDVCGAASKIMTSRELHLSPTLASQIRLVFG